MPEFYRQSIAETLADLETNVEQGLNGVEVSQRQSQYGNNVLPTDAGTNWFKTCSTAMSAMSAFSCCKVQVVVRMRRRRSWSCPRPIIVNAVISD